MSPTSTSSSDTRRAARFALRWVLFAAPLLILVGGLEMGLHRTGDLWSLDTVCTKQMTSDGFLFGSGYSNGNREYQMEMMKRKGAEILILGSSRVLQARDFMFHPLESKFYNAGMTVTNLEDLQNLVTSFSTGQATTPRFILLGIDPNWLLQPGTQPRSTKTNPTDFHMLDLQSHTRVLRTMLLSARGQVSLSALKTGATGPSPYYGIPAVGNRALSKGVGFRRDGSRQYDPEILLQFKQNPEYQDRENPPIIQRVREQRPPYGLTPLRADFENEITRTLKNLKAQGIEVAVFLPPFSDEVRQELGQLPHWSRLRQQYAKGLKQICRDLDLPFLNATDHHALGLSDLYMFDGIHPSEVYMAHAVRWFIQRAPSGSVLNQVDGEYLQGLLDAEQVIPLSLKPPWAID